MPNVEMPDGQIAEFPDSMSNDQIESVIKNHLAENSHVQGWSGVLKDALSGVANVPSALVSSASGIPSALMDSQMWGFHPVRSAVNLGGGSIQGLEGLVNIPANIANYLSSKGIGSDSYQKSSLGSMLNISPKSLENSIGNMKIPELDLKKYLGQERPADQLLKGIGSFLPYGIAGGAEKGLAGLVQRGAASGAYGVGQDQNPVTTALMSAVPEGAGNIASRASKSFSLLPSSPLTDDQLRQASQLTSGTETDLGNIIENPYLKRLYENALPDIPFSGANQAMQRTAKLITDKGQNLLDQLKGNNDTSDIGFKLQQALKDASDETKEEKDQKFSALNDEADKQGVTTDRSNLRKVAKQELSKINSDPDLSSVTDSSVKSLLGDLVKNSPNDIYSNVVDKNGNPIFMGKTNDQFSLKNTDFLRSELGERAFDAYLDNNSNLSSTYTKLKNAADKDINTSIDKSGNDNLKSLRDDAMDFYKKEYSPFEDKDIMKFTRQGGDPDVLASNFIKTSTISDRGNLLSKLTSKLQPEDRNLLSYSYFSRALKDGELNPQTLATLFSGKSGLGDKQKAALLSPDMVKNFSDYSDLVEKNKEPLNIMFNPKTGQRNSSLFSSLLPAFGSGGAALATHSFPLAIGGAIAPSLIARPIVKALTSQTMRDNLIDKLINARANRSLSNTPMQPFINALMQSSNRQQGTG